MHFPDSQDELQVHFVLESSRLRQRGDRRGRERGRGAKVLSVWGSASHYRHAVHGPIIHGSTRDQRTGRVSLRGAILLPQTGTLPERGYHRAGVRQSAELEPI